MQARVSSGVLWRLDRQLNGSLNAPASFVENDPELSLTWAQLNRSSSVRQTQEQDSLGNYSRS